MALYQTSPATHTKTQPPASGMPEFLSRVPRPFTSRAFTQKQPEVPAIVPEEPPSAALPPVVSVKKSARGCAVVLLRDESIVERCALQRVAVIDGVCVEMKRHTREFKEEGEEDPSGIFCAWGMKVERKVPVSEEGIEEFFNSLSGKPCPEGLAVKAPFEESHLSFPLSSEGFAMLSFMIQEEAADKAQILSSKYCTQDIILASWAAKDRLDALWNRPPPPMARSLITRVARKELFPHSGEGGQEHENRAGDKLAQISEIVDLMDGIPQGSAFLDLCGGPGAWSQHLLGKEDLALKGFGFTLKAASGGSEDWKAQEKDEWYEDLYEHPDWTALWGLDGTGDLLKSGNVEHCVKQLARKHVLLVVADGGFSDDAIPPNQLELYFYRLFLAELLTAASCLGAGGKFVCKLYSTFSDSTAALLFLTTQLFESVSVVKPISSKCTGPERYLVGSGFRDDAQTSAICAALARSHALGAGASPLTMPLLTPAVPAESLLQDQAFSTGLKHMVTAMCQRQTQALNAVVDRADFLEDVAMACAVCTDPWEKHEPKVNSNGIPVVEEKWYDGDIQCPHCTKTYRQQERLNQHLEKKHANHTDGACPVNNLPTPARARATKGKGGKGKGTGKGKGAGKVAR